MDINIETADQVTRIEITGDIDGKTAPEVQQQISSHLEPGGKVLLDMSRVDYMSSAGLRMLLSTYRQISGSNGRIVLVGLSEEIEDTMSATGFLSFFTTQETVDAGLAALE
jgi:anti-sigma B factor antagonist